MVDTLSISHMAYPVTALGPGNRIALWVAGCPMRCMDCITPHLQDKNNGKVVAVDKLLQRILSLDKRILGSINGITFTGGEPFSQAEYLAELWQGLKQAFPNWNLLVFSGYQLSALQQKQEYSALLAKVDILIDGPYLPELAKGIKDPLIASTNQNTHLLTERGHALSNGLNKQKEVNLGMGNQHNWLIGIVDKRQRLNYHQLINA